MAGVGYANVLPSLSRYGVDEPPFQEFVDQDQQLWEEYNGIIEAWEEQHPRPDDIYFRGLDESGRVRYYHPLAYRWMAERNPFVIDKRLEAASRRFKMWQANQQPLAREAYIVDEWGILSPLVNYQILACQLARTTLSDAAYLSQLGHRYRDTYYDYLRSRGAFASWRWFTDDPPGQEPFLPHPEEVSAEDLLPDSPFMEARLAWMDEQEKQAEGDARRHLSLTNMPKFGGATHRSLAESLGIMAPGLAVMLLSCGLGVLLVVVRFLRYDPQTGSA